MNFNYKALKGRIVAVYGNQEAFAEAMNMSRTAISQRLNDNIEWRISEIAKACDVLGIPQAEAYLYFFTQEV